MYCCRRCSSTMYCGGGWGCCGCWGCCCGGGCPNPGNKLLGLGFGWAGNDGVKPANGFTVLAGAGAGAGGGVGVNPENGLTEGTGADGAVSNPTENGLKGLVDGCDAGTAAGAGAGVNPPNGFVDACGWGSVNPANGFVDGCGCVHSPSNGFEGAVNGFGLNGCAGGLLVNPAKGLSLAGADGCVIGRKSKLKMDAPPPPPPPPPPPLLLPPTPKPLSATLDATDGNVADPEPW